MQRIADRAIRTMGSCSSASPDLSRNRWSAGNHTFGHDKARGFSSYIGVLMHEAFYDMEREGNL
jgi:hypothetical protein